MAGTGLRSLTSTLDRRRRVILGLLALATMALAVGGGATPGSTTWTGLPGKGALTLLLPVTLAIGLLIMVTALIGLRRPGQRVPQRRGSWQVLVLVVIIAVLSRFLPHEEPELAELDTEPAELAEPTPPDRTRSGGGLAASDLAVLVAILVGGTAVLWWLRRGEPEADLPDGEPEADQRLSPALRRASEHLFRSTDPRAAVMLAYRELEQTLEGLDLPRAPSETPVEHLGRALDALSVADPVDARPLLDLADLYQSARFSEHSITADDQRQAAEALAEAHLRLTRVGS